MNSKISPHTSPEESVEYLKKELAEQLRQRFSGMKLTSQTLDRVRDSISQTLKARLAEGAIPPDVQVEVNPHDPSQISVKMKIPTPRYVWESTLEKKTPHQESENQKSNAIQRDPEYDWDWT